MNKVWFFGDSFCAYQENWVLQVAKNLNAEIANLGIGRSSIYFLLQDLLLKKDKIGPNDTVIVCITDPIRQYMGAGYRFHLNPGGTTLKQTLKYWEPTTHEEYLEIVDVFKSYDSYVKHLLKPEDIKLYSQAIVSHILETILPSLNTDNYQYLYCFYPIDYYRYSFLEKYTSRNNEIGIQQIITEWHQNCDRSLFKLYGKEYVNESPNHWISHPDFEKFFWEKMNPLLEKIGADTKL